MKKESILSVLTFILISCSNNESVSETLKNIPVIIQNDGTSLTRLFSYENKKIIKTDRTSILPYKISDFADIFHYDSFNRIEKFTTFHNIPIVFDIKYENEKIKSFKAARNVDTVRIDLTYIDNKVIEKQYIKDMNSENYKASSSETVLTFSNGNIIKKVVGDQDGDQIVTEFFYDNKKSPFSNIHDFENFQLIFTSNEGYWYWISELFFGKNNLLKKEFTWLPTGEKTITEYENIYNTNDYPTNINSIIIDYD